MSFYAKAERLEKLRDFYAGNVNAEISKEEVEYALDRLNNRGITPTYIKERAGDVIKQWSYPRSMYRYLIQAFPCKTEEHLSAMEKAHIKEVRSMAFATPDYVGFSETEFQNRLAECIATASKITGDDIDVIAGELSWSHEIAENIETILAHEYTHILCQHSQMGYKIAQREGKNFQAKTFNIACDIIANRGYNVEPLSAFYPMSMTDTLFEKDIPNIKKMFDEYSIYKLLNKHFGKGIDKIAKAIETGDKEKIEQAKKESGMNEQQANAVENSLSRNMPQSDVPQDMESKMGFDDRDLDRRIEEMMSGSPNSSTQQNQNQGGDNRSQNQPNNQTNNQGSEPFPDNEDEEEGPPSGGGNGEGGLGKIAHYDPADILKIVNERLDTETLEKALKKLRKVVKGDSSMTKVKSYSRPPRRNNDSGLFKKGIKKSKDSSPRILLALDKSGSMSSVNVTRIANIVDRMIKTIGRSTVGCFICCHDHEVRLVRPLKQWADVVALYEPDGGNDFSAVYETALSLGVDVVLNVGDGADIITRGASLKGIKPNPKLKWYDVLVEDNGYYQSDDIEDNSHGFKRERIDLSLTAS